MSCLQKQLALWLRTSGRGQGSRAKLFASTTIIFLTVVGIFVAPLAYARIAINTIDPLAKISDNGRRIHVTGPIQTDVVERVFLRVTVTQRTTGAVAEGIAVFRSTGQLQQWEVDARTRGKATFDAGPATAVAIATTTDHGKVSDAHQWLVNITLEPK